MYFKFLNLCQSDSDYESAVTDLGNQALESIDGMIADLELWVSLKLFITHI